MHLTMYSPSILPEEPELRQEDVDDEDLPSESQLVLLCLDHLRDLRRSFTKKELLQAEGMDADYLSVAIYALSRVFVKPPELTNDEGNDCKLNRERANELVPGLFPPKDPPSSKNFISIPNLNSINQEIFYSTSEQEYEYDDGHASNAHRFYPLDGLASGPTLGERGPLTLGELTVAGLAGLGARSRIAAEEDVRESPLFDQFVSAVRSKGFFRDPETEQPRENPEEEKERLRRAAFLEEERLQKVMGKVRTKLASKALQQLNDHVGDIPPLYDDYLVMSAAERLERRRMAHVQEAERMRNDKEVGMRGAAPPPPRPPPPPAINEAAQYRQSLSSSSPQSSPEMKRTSSPRAGESLSPSTTKQPGSNVKEAFSADAHGLQHVSSSTLTSPVANTRKSPSHEIHKVMMSPRAAAPPMDNPVDIEEAERLKAIGNTHMQKKEYTQAAEAYTSALTLSPNGPHTHVYYSNRAAALLSMKRFDEAIADSERSLALKPDYGKAHARLGLAHFLLGNYRLAVEAYTVSLKYEPNNKSTKNYLEKAAKRAAAMDANAAANTSGGDHGVNAASSFSYISEQERSESAARRRKSNSPGIPMPRGEEASEERNQKAREKDAEKLKLKGNSYMANRDYEAALKSYTLAVKLSPDGPNSYVYYSNRAAALCYLERYEEAEADSEHSLMLAPTYGKAHARLGLSRFFMGDYSGAIEAYTAALEYDPENAASKSYLAKARARLAKQSGEGHSSSKAARKAEPTAPRKDSFDEIMNASITTPADVAAAEI